MLRIEDYALIGDMHTAALVGNDGSIDWMCVPHFGSPACFAGLLGSPDHGRWLLGPCAAATSVARRYRPETLILETDFTNDEGAVRLIDFMPAGRADSSLVRIVEGLKGEVTMRLEFVVRFDYGSVVPWTRPVDGGLLAVGGPDAVSLRTPVPAKSLGLRTEAEFKIREGERIPFVLMWHPSHVTPPEMPEAESALKETEAWWQAWCAKCTYHGPWRSQVLRSLITLKALTSASTGGIIAAPTTSLPEHIGGVRNWDYRYCWLRDATFTLYSLMLSGYMDEARAWRDWLLRTVAGDPSQLQIMYGANGERRLAEFEVPWLPGYENSRPVRIGNGAVGQRQLDVYGEVMDALHLAHRAESGAEHHAWALQVALLNLLEPIWPEPDEGIWEVRGPRRHFTHSKVMAWVAFDRGIKAVEQFSLPGPVDGWRVQRDKLYAEIWANGFDAKRNTFTQYYGSTELDASLLMLPLVGFVAADDPRMLGTVAAIERDLVVDGLVQRYRTARDGHVDGLPKGEGVFLACSFWLADNYILQGHPAEGRRMFERLMALTNDVGLLAEEYDPAAKRMLGNFPQAFSHIALVNTALNLFKAGGPAQDRQAT